jgi:hypothetical protein
MHALFPNVGAQQSHAVEVRDHLEDMLCHVVLSLCTMYDRTSYPVKVTRFNLVEIP